MKYMTDVYFNANEFVLNAVKEQVEKKFDIECKTNNDFLFIPHTASDKWDDIVELLANVDKEAIESEVAHELVNDESKNTLELTKESVELLHNAFEHACDSYDKGVYETDEFVVVFVKNEDGELVEMDELSNLWTMIHSKLHMVHKQGGTDRLSAMSDDKQIVFELK